MKRRSLLANKTATVYVDRNGAGIKIEDVPATQAGAVLADLLEAMRALAQHYDELIPDLTPVPGGSPVEYVDDLETGDRAKRRVGFTR